MTFTEQNTIENAIRDHLCGLTGKQDQDSVGEDQVPYLASATPEKPYPVLPPWKFVAGEDLILHGKQPQDVFVETWLKDALCRLNKPLAGNPDLADEVIHRMRGVLLEAGYSGLVRANELFMKWLLGRGIYLCPLERMGSISPSI